VWVWSIETGGAWWVSDPVPGFWWAASGVWCLKLGGLVRPVGRPQMPVCVGSIGTLGGGGWVPTRPFADPVPSFWWAEDSAQLVLVVDAVLLWCFVRDGGWYLWEM
jgi:hypothetical protein